jgi:hypothetical protein
MPLHATTDHGTIATAVAPAGNRRHTRYTVTLPQNTASAGFQSDTNLNTIFSLVPGKIVSVALSSSAILAAN